MGRSESCMKAVAAVVLLAIAIGIFQYWRRNWIGESGFGFKTTAEELVYDINLHGKVVLITGYICALTPLDGDI